jgi:hypothetical protein
LTYLYSDGSRYWFDVHPTVTRIARDRAAQFKADVVEDEIIRRLRAATKERADFAGVHAAPADSSEVPDEQACRLVVLAPKSPYTKANGDSPSHVAAQDILDKRGNSPRLYRNMLVFLAPDRERLTELEQAVRDWLAWTSIDQEKEQLNLDAVQRRQVDTSLTKAKESIESRIGETYRHLLIPTQEGTGPIEWTRVPLQGQESIVTRASKKMKAEGHFILSWSPALLKRELDRWLWKDQPHLGMKQLWEYLCKYLYLPRLRDESVLLDVIRQGAGSLTWKDFYAYASAYDEGAGRYQGLVTGQIPHVALDSASLIVKPDAATAQLTKDAEQQARATYTPTGDPANGQPVAETTFAVDAPAGAILQPPTVRLTRFHGSVTLDPSRMGRDAGRIAEEIVSHLAALKGAKVQVSLEIQIEVADGVPDEVIRIIQENSNTLKFKSHGFEEG